MCRLCDESDPVFEHVVCERCGEPICLDGPTEQLKLAVDLNPGWECIDCVAQASNSN